MRSFQGRASAARMAISARSTHRCLCGHRSTLARQRGPQMSAPESDGEKAGAEDESTGAARLGFRMHAEWEPRAATWLAWPHNETDWPGRFEVIPATFIELIRLLHQV